MNSFFCAFWYSIWLNRGNNIVVMKARFAIFLGGLILLISASSCVGYYHDHGPRHPHGHHKKGHNKHHHKKEHKRHNKEHGKHRGRH